MKTVTVSQRSRVIKDLLKIAKQEDVVIRTSEGDEFMISLVDDFGHEVAQQRQNKKLMAFLDARFKKARAEPGTPLAEVIKELGRNNGRKKPRSADK